MKVKLTSKSGDVIHQFEITEGAPAEPPEIVIYPQHGGPFVLAQRTDSEGAYVYRPAKGVVSFPDVA